MQMRTQRRVFWGGLLVLFFGAITLWLAAIANGPDRELSFVREVPSELEPATLDRAIRILNNWPHWYFSTQEVRAFDPQRGTEFPLADQYVVPNLRVRFRIEPPQKSWKRFELVAEIVRYEPEKLIEVQLISDSTGRITNLFDRLRWKIELEPRPEGFTLIRGTLKAHTASWRSRLFGTIAERILMNQLFYPDLVKLSQLKRPLPLIPTRQTQR